MLTGRGIARAFVRKMPAYVQNALVVGAGHVGQLVARKILQHPEYGIELRRLRRRRTRATAAPTSADLPILGGITDLPEHRLGRGASTA